MIGWAARKCLQVLDNVEYVLAIELFATCQALELQRPLKATPQIESIFEHVRKIVPFLENDAVMSEHIQNLSDDIRKGSILRIVL